MDDRQRTNLTKGIAESKALIKAFESGLGAGGGKSPRGSGDRTQESLDRERERLAYLEARLVRFSV
jgi:hypothetical protein